MKRTSEKQITKDDLRDEEGEEGEKEPKIGPDAYEKASSDVLAARRIVKVRRKHAPAPTTPKSGENGGVKKEDGPVNPFAGGGFKLAPAAVPTTRTEETKPKQSSEAQEKKDEEEKAGDIPKDEVETEKPTKESGSNSDGGEDEDEALEDDTKETKEGENGKKEAYNGFANRPNPFVSSTGGSLFQPKDDAFKSDATNKGILSFGSRGFGGLAASGASAGFGGLAAAGTTAGFGFGSATASGFGKTTSIFGNKAENGDGKEAEEKEPSRDTYVAKHPVVKLEEKDMKTGEEDEKVAYTQKGVLYEYVDNSWKERGRGDVRINIDSNKSARIVMRSRGNLRLLMNAKLWPEMQCNKMIGTNGVTFAVVNYAAPAQEDEGKTSEDGKDETGKAEPSLSTYAIRVKSPEVVDELMSAIDKHKIQSA